MFWYTALIFCTSLLKITGDEMPRAFIVHRKKVFPWMRFGNKANFYETGSQKIVYILVSACSSAHSHHQPNLIVPCTHVSGGDREQGIIKPPYQRTLSMKNIFHLWSCPRRFFHLILWTIQRSPIIRNSRKWPKIVPRHQLFSGTHNMHLTTETYMHNVIVTYMSRKAI